MLGEVRAKLERNRGSAPLFDTASRIRQLEGAFLLMHERATRGVFQLLCDINAAGTVVVMATHDLDLVRQAPYRVIELQEGALVYDSSVDEARDQAAAP